MAPLTKRAPENASALPRRSNHLGLLSIVLAMRCELKVLGTRGTQSTCFFADSTFLVRQLLV
jgi:hypothetical protein